MNLKDTFVLTEGFEVFRFSGLAPCENSLDAEFKLALQKLRHSHSSVIIPPTVYNCGNKSGPHVCVPGLFLACFPLHLHGLQGVIPMTLSACGVLPSPCCSAAHRKHCTPEKEEKRLQHCTEN